jgi:DNA polymerase elongation subunit (family B)
VYDEDNDQNGGIFEIVNPDFKFKAIPYVFEGDYFSLYPTIILAFNISPETVIDSN